MEQMTSMALAASYMSKNGASAGMSLTHGATLPRSAEFRR